jgi:cystathionine beta-lyase
VHTATASTPVARLAAEFGVDVVVDEIHALLVPEGTTFTPYLSVADFGLARGDLGVQGVTTSPASRRR